LAAASVNTSADPFHASGVIDANSFCALLPPGAEVRIAGW
jgi:hypothetical protein